IEFSECNFNAQFVGRCPTNWIGRIKKQPRQDEPAGVSHFSNVCLVLAFVLFHKCIKAVAQ
ncbi:MAG: hypothetical protein KDD27_18770, partial [Saprospiraceae bacterium]|nr:hypothetical protein [Saprospiraceae bacterium]